VKNKLIKKSKIYMKYNLIILSLLLVNGCDLNILSGTGTHGNLGDYTYYTSKVKLETAIESVITNSSIIEKLKTDGDTYTSIIIKTEVPYCFVFRFYGDEEYYKLHPNESEIFITAIKKANGEYKSEKEISKKEKKEAVEVFDEYFIAKLDESGIKRKRE